MKTCIFMVMCILFLTGCIQEPSAPIAPMPVGADFSDYWYRGQAELTSYALEQARYGEVHQGKAVLIFVTEDFSKEKQVKLDNYASADDDRVTVLKLNLTKEFLTGIYPYSMMTSTFTPVSGGRTLKVTTSSQEWCGHTFAQFNLENGTYQVQHYSYFESDGDRTVQLEGTLLEDEVWNRIRLNPETLPTGDIRIVAGSMYQRLGHAAIAVENAQAHLETLENGEKAYTLTYPSLDRTLTIRYESAFPHAITGWEETYDQLTTLAMRDQSIMLDYWNRNSNADSTLRAELGLP